MFGFLFHVAHEKLCTPHQSQIKFCHPETGVALIERAAWSATDVISWNKAPDNNKPEWDCCRLLYANLEFCAAI
jgi:hypothetical protein